jgi:type IV pilus assembly protein PilQ
LLIYFTVTALLAITPPGGREARAEDPAGAAGAPRSTTAGQPVVSAIDLVKSAAGTQITISGDTELSYEYFVIEGRSLAIDVPGARSTVAAADRQVADEFVSRIQVAATTGEAPGVRVLLSLKKPDGFSVRGEHGRIVVQFAAREERSSLRPAALNRVSEVVAARVANVFRVAVKTDEKPSYRVLESGDSRRVTIAIDGATLGAGLPPANDYSALDGPVTRVATSTDPREPNVVLVAIDVRQALPFRAFADGYGVNIDFSISVSERMEPMAFPSPARSPAAAASRLRTPEPPGAEHSGVAAPYTGGKITLDFIDADIADIFRLIADVSGMNIIATDDVKSKRSVTMTQVPWDQALDLILKTNIPPLARVDEGRGVIRITTRQRIQDEETQLSKQKIERLAMVVREQEMSRKSAEASQALVESQRAKQQETLKRQTPLEEYVFNVSYGDTKKIGERLLAYSATKTGDCGFCIFEVDERASRIKVRDLSENIDSMIDVFTALDEPTPAVMVEARIVEVQSDFSESLGIQWGANFAADAEHGNATKFAFPNSIGIGGTQPENFLVNLPASGPVGGVGLTLGHVANTFSLDIRLSAMEKLGKTKILSNPKVLVIQNEEAKINVGSQLPIPRTDTEGNRTNEWKDVGILLQVRPQVTNDGSVFMKIQIEKSARGETVKTT